MKVHFFPPLPEILFAARRLESGTARAGLFSASACGNLKGVSKFWEGLENLKTKLLEMSSLVEAGIQRSIHAVVQRDGGAAEKVLETEARINTIELEIDALVIDLLALHQPMAASATWPSTSPTGRSR